MSLTGRMARAWRSRSKRWSPERDRVFHDALFDGGRLDPFTFAYPGYVTIRRFADLASERLGGLCTVLDLGCGPAEITCELARRHPDITLLGVDHSATAIERACANARALELRNVTFERADIAQYEPPRPVDIVLMFDAFHHAQDPRALVRRLGRFTRRFFLVEPHGDWKGSWRREIDCDWVLLEMDKIRRRLASLVGEVPGEGAPLIARPDEVGGAKAGGPGRADPGEPTENRYSLEEFERFFDGYGIEIAGTVGGIDVYPPDARKSSRTREWFGEVACELLGRVDAALRERDLDLLAKHWAIYCELGARGTRRRVPPVPPQIRTANAEAGDAGADVAVQGPHDVEYGEYNGARDFRAGTETMASLCVRNRSWNTWSSRVEQPVFVSYHWLHRDGSVAVFDGSRNALPRPLAPGEECDVALRVHPPDQPGRYLLAFDLVQEGVSWFSEAGSACLRIPVRVRRGRLR